MYLRVLGGVYSTRCSREACIPPGAVGRRVYLRVEEGGGYTSGLKREAGMGHLSAQKGSGNGTPLCADVPPNREYMGGYPTSIRSLLSYHPGERNNSAQTARSFITGRRR